MAIAKIVLYPDSILRKISSPVTVFGKALERILKALQETMEAQPSGIGIAAPQIGILKRVAVVDVSRRVRGAERLCLVNPEIIEYKSEVLSREGCMSLPEYTAYLKRHDWLRLRWQDACGHLHQKIATGIEAICIQHEIDHLNGALFFDRVVALKTDMIPRKSSVKLG
ncbi:MAG TPA: peptide deformylase [bacterium]|nr:peptide deformylase [bacterium]